MTSWVLAAASVVALVWLGGAARWHYRTRALLHRLAATRRRAGDTGFDPAELETLPAPVQRYFRAVLQPGQAIASSVELQHTGTFDVGAARANWRTFHSRQHVITRRPGFVWAARIRMLPGLGVFVRDAYVAGEGVLQASVLGLWSVADRRPSRELAEGELTRFLAEAVWYPTALLQSQGVRWHGIDERSARAVLADGPIVVSLTFHFDDQGLIDTASADARARSAGGAFVPTPWQGRFSNYGRRGGVHVPLDGEAAWLLPDGPRPYWRGHLERLQHGSAHD